MLRLKRLNESPKGGFSYIDRKTGFSAHGWSFQSVAAQWFKEQIKRGIKYTLDKAKLDVEQYTCQELMKSAGWEGFVEVVSEWKADEYPSIESFERETTSPKVEGELFSIVFPFCLKDAQGALKLMKWISEITPVNDHILVLSHDLHTPRHFVDEIGAHAQKSFRTVKVHSYSPPMADQWPPTIAFKAAAYYMQKVGTPWLWMEFDMIPIKPHWIDALQQAYWRGGKAFAGPIVKDLGHCNGTAIYPCNTPQRIPRALSLTRTAWDVTMKGEMINDCYNLHPLFYHVWGVYGGHLHPYIGSPPEFPRGSPLMAQIPKEAVVLHRNKSGNLIDRLREQRQLQPA